MNRPTFEPGWYPDIPNETYHAAEGLSASGAKKFLTKNGEHIAHELANPTKPQSDRIIGSACHCLLLQPSTFDSEFLVHETFDMRKKASQEALLELRAYNPTKQLLTEIEYTAAKRMAARALAHPTAGAYLEQFIGESSVFETVLIAGADPEDMVEPLLKCRPDALPLRMPIIADVKTTMDGSQSGFARQVEKLHYHMGAFHYLTVCNESEPLRAATGIDYFEQFVFIAIENFAPYCVACYDLSPRMLEEGKRLWRIAVDRWLSGASERGYPEAVRTLEFGQSFNREAV